MLQKKKMIDNQIHGKKKKIYISIDKYINGLVFIYIYFGSISDEKKKTWTNYRVDKLRDRVGHKKYMYTKINPPDNNINIVISTYKIIL